MSGSSRSKWSEWSSCLYFYNYDQQPKPKVVQMNKRKMKRFRFPKRQQKVVQIYRFIHPLLSSQLSWRIWHHAYIVIRTDKNELWSFEKNGKGVLVQRETEANYCLKLLHGKWRSWICTLKSFASCVISAGVSVEDILEWIVKNGELDKAYDLLGDNCQDFADRITEFITKFVG
jgi:hypothetical protein